MAFLPLTDSERAQMLQRIGVPSVDDLFADIPSTVRFPQLDLPGPLSELEALQKMSALARRNQPIGELIGFTGAGCYHHYVPAAVLAMMTRSEFLTSYTPYQAEMSQGNLQVMFELQSLCCDLFELDVANSGVYDGSSATAEA